jgi:hypothetical protein
MESQPGTIWGREPAMVLALVQAVIALVVAFGLNLAPDQIGAIPRGHRGGARTYHAQPGEPGVRGGYLRGTLPGTPTARQVEVLSAYVAVGGSVRDAAARIGLRPSTAKRHLADLWARSGLTTEQLTTSAGQPDGSSCRAWSHGRGSLGLRMAVYPSSVMDAREKMNVALGRTSLVVAASDGPGG